MTGQSWKEGDSHRWTSLRDSSLLHMTQGKKLFLLLSNVDDYSERMLYE